jgi:hypothetical protein
MGTTTPIIFHGKGSGKLIQGKSNKNMGFWGWFVETQAEEFCIYW